MENKFVLTELFSSPKRYRDLHSFEIKLIDCNECVLSTLDVFEADYVAWFYNDTIKKIITKNEDNVVICNLESFDKQKGYGESVLLKAIEKFESVDIYSIIQSDNIPSINLHKKVGFELIETVKNKFIFKFKKWKK